jgi:hypothetical protein
MPYFQSFTTASEFRSLAASSFSTTFDPQEITDIIAQVLLPNAKVGNLLKDRVKHRGAKAVLSNLAVETLENPLHVYNLTPYSFGSLLVCLPHSFSGGGIHISSGGHSMNFDLGGDGLRDEEPAKIHWLAYADGCETKFETLISGRRVVLIYKLVVTEQVGKAIQGKEYPMADAS